MKRCCRCKADKLVDQFGRDKTRKDGLTPRCRECNAEYLREWKAANYERKLELNREWSRRNPAYYRKWRAAWRAANPEANRAADKRWRDNNPNKIRVKDMRRRVVANGGVVGEVDLRALWEANQGNCQLCGLPIDPALPWPHPLSKSVDHIVPLSRGGRHEQSNLQWTHLVENIQKGAKTPVPLGG